MTDNEIIKALEYCCHNGHCRKCPHNCVENKNIEDLALDLINRQKAEIERFQNKVEELSEVLSDTIRIRYAECKANAIKDFAYKLKQIPHSVVYKWQIDDVAKEMVGDAD